MNDFQDFVKAFGGRVVVFDCRSGQMLEPRTAADGPTVPEAKAALEQAAACLTGDARATWEGMDRAGKNEMVVAVQNGADPEVIVREHCGAVD